MIKKAVTSVTDFAAAGDEIDKMSQKMGISTQAYQEWDAILQHSGTSIEAMKPAFKTLVNAAESGSEACAELGITQEEIANMNQEELFSKTISALQDMDSSTERAYLAQKLLGKGGTELGALLNTSAEETEAMRQRVHELGGVLSDDAVKGSAAFQDALQDMQTAFKGIGNSLLSGLMQPLSSVMEGITQIFAGDSSSGIGLIKQGITDFVESIVTAVPEAVENIRGIIESVFVEISESMPQMIEKGGDFIMSLVNGFVERIPDFINSISNFLSSVIDFIYKNMPAFQQKGMEIVTNLALGLIKNLPTIINSVVNLIGNLISKILEYLPTILSTGLQLMGQLVGAIIQSIPGIVVAAGSLVVDLVKAFVSKVPEFVEAGKNMLLGLRDGIVGAVGNVIQGAIEAAKGIVNAVKGFFGIASPSKLFRDQIGKNMALGIGVGFEKYMPTEEMADTLQSSMDDVLGNADGVIESNLSGAVVPLKPTQSNASNNNYGGNTIIINADGVSAQEIAYEVQRIINADTQREELVFA